MFEYSKKYRLLILLGMLIILVTKNGEVYADAKLDSLQRVLQNPAINDVDKVDTYLALARYQAEDFRDLSIKTCRDALIVARRNNYNIGIAAAYHQMASLYMRLPNYDSALHYFKYALTTSNANRDDSQQVDIKLEMSDALFENHQGNPFFYAAEALNQARKANYRRGISHAYNQLGTMYYRISKYDSSVLYLQAALAESKSLNDDVQSGEILNNLGNNYLDLSQYNLALDFYTKAIVYMRKQNRLRNEALTLANIGLIYHVREQYDKALEFHIKSLNIHRFLNSSDEDLCVSYIEIAEVLLDKKNLMLTEIYIDSAAQYIKSEDALYSKCLVNRLRGDLAFKRKVFVRACSFYRKSIELAYQISYERGAIDTKNKLASSLLEMADYESAKNVALEANKAACALDIKEQIAESELLLSNIYSKLNDYVSAHYHLDRYRLFNDSLHDTEKSNFLAEMQTRFSTQEKEFENDELKRKQIAKDELINLRNNQIYAVIVGAFLLFLIAIYEFFQYRKKQRLNQELTRLNSDISKQKEELEVQAIELSKLSREIEEKNKLLEHDNRKKERNIINKEKRILDFAFFNAHELRACVARILGLVNVFKLSFYNKDDLEGIVGMVEKSTLELDVIVKDFGNRLIVIEEDDEIESNELKEPLE